MADAAPEPADGPPAAGSAPGGDDDPEPDPTIVSYVIAVFLVILIPTLLCTGAWFLMRIVDRYLVR